MKRSAPSFLPTPAPEFKLDREFKVPMSSVGSSTIQSMMTDSLNSSASSGGSNSINTPWFNAQSAKKQAFIRAKAAYRAITGKPLRTRSKRYKRGFKRGYRKAYRSAPRLGSVPLSYSINGRGDYKSFMRNVIPDGSFSAAGGRLGTMLGNSIGGFGNIGADLGSKAGSWLSKILGFGDYAIASNTLMTTTGPPVFDTGKRYVDFAYREYIQDISTDGSSGGFSSITFPIQPGLASTFPYLSGLANQFEQYEFQGLIFEYKSLANNPIGQTTIVPAGCVICATNYDVLSPAFTSKAQMEQSAFSTCGTPGQDIIAPIECAPMEQSTNLFYVRDGPVPTGDLRFNDKANFQIAISGVPDAGTPTKIGELWVSYHIRLYKPWLGSGDYTGSLMAKYTVVGYDPATAPFGTALSLNYGSLDVLWTSAFSVSLPNLSPNSTYVGVFAQTSSPGGAVTTTMSPTYSNASALVGPLGASSSVVVPTSGTAGVTLTWASFSFQVASNPTGPVVVGFPFGAVTTNGTAAAIYFYKVANN